MRFIMLMTVVFFSVSCLASSKLASSEFSESSFEVENETFKDEWLLAAELGLTMTSGNTQTQTLLGKINGGLTYLSGRLTYLASFYQKTVNDVKSADKWTVGLKHNIYFNDNTSSFAIAEYAKDDFASTRTTTTIAAGYTQRLFDNNIVQWDADIGPGFVWTDYGVDTQTKKIMHLGSKFKFNFTEKTSFEQFIVADLDIESTNKDVYRWETSLSASIVENFKMKVSYAMKLDNVVDVEKEKLDTETSMSLVYIF